MSWPTLTARVAGTDYWLDHFDGALNARWTSVVSGTGDVTLTDSYAAITKAAVTDAAYLYLNTPLDTAANELFLVCFSIQQDGWRRGAQVISSATPGTPPAFGAGDMVAQIQLTSSAADYFGILEYWTAGPTRNIWDPSAGAWTTTAANANDTTWNEMYLDDYVIWGFEIDGANDRFRMLTMTQCQPTAGSYTQLGGAFRVNQLTDWVDWDTAQLRTNLYLVLGDHWAQTSIADTRVEWVRREFGTVRHAYVNGKTTAAGNYDIRRHYSYGDIYVPLDRSTVAVAGAASGWEGATVKDPFLLLYGSTYYLFYDSSATYWQVGAASSSAIDGTWTKLNNTPQDTQQGTLSYQGNDTTTAEFRDITPVASQDFSTWASTPGGPAAYWIKVTNSDATVSYGYLGAANNGNADVDIYADYGLTTRGWLGVLPVAGIKTPSSYAVFAAGENANPILTSVPATEEQSVYFPYLIDDQVETDAGKRFKLLYTAFDGTNGRIYYADAPHPLGPYANRQKVIDIGTGWEASFVSNPVPVYRNGVWEVWYGGLDASGFWQTGRATGTSLTSLTKDAGNPLLSYQANGTEAIATNASGRTLTVADTTGFTAGHLLWATQDSNSDNFTISRIRKVTSGTQLELFHRVDMNFGTVAGHIQQDDAAHGIYPRHIVREGNMWRMYGVTFRLFRDVVGMDAFDETTTVWEHSGAGPGDAAWALVDEINPPILFTRFGHERSSENVSLLMPAFNEAGGGWTADAVTLQLLGVMR